MYSSFLNKLKDLENVKIFTELDTRISNKEIINAIASLKNNKASSFDQILNEMLKFGQTYIIDPLCKLFNNILSTGKFPVVWANGIIVPIFKSGEKCNPSNYREITIGSCIGKLFLKILNNRLDNFLTMHNIICPEQIGFSKDSRTSDHMFVLKTLIDKYTQQGSKHLYTCFVDFRKAFDTVWHIGLLYKLRNSGVSDLFYNVIKNMYENTLLSVKVNNIYLTDHFQSFVGVRQDDNLKPTLLKLIINDLPNIFDDSCSPVSLLTRKLHCLLYADDLVLLSESLQGLQNSLTKLSHYCDEWGLQIDISKTKSLVFNNTGRITSHKFYINNIPIENCRNYVYLGVNFSISGSFTEAKNNLYHKGLKVLFKVKKCFQGHSPKIKTILHIFDHTIKPILLNGSEIWGSFSAQKLLRQGDNYFAKVYRDLIAEKAHFKLCKYSIKVGEKATNSAVMGELGRYPLFLEVLLNMIKII